MAYTPEHQRTRYSFSQAAPPSLPQSPTSQSPSRHSHTMSNESIGAVFHHDPNTLSFSVDPSTMNNAFSHPASAVHSPVLMSAFPAAALPTNSQNTAGYPLDSMMRHRGSSFTSSHGASPSRSGFETPLTPLEYGATQPLTQTVSSAGFDPDYPHISTADLITLSILQGIETSVREAREAMARGDKASFHDRTQHVLSSADLLRGAGAASNQHYTQLQQHLPMMDHNELLATDGLNFDAIDLSAPHNPQSQSQTPAPLLPSAEIQLPQGSGSSGLGINVSDASGVGPSLSRYSSHDHLSSPSHRNPNQSQGQTPHSFAYGLAVLNQLDAADSRKRTISTATARATETDRAAKTQKTGAESQSQSRRESVSSTGVTPLSRQHSSSGINGMVGNIGMGVGMTGVVSPSEFMHAHIQNVNAASAASSGQQPTDWMEYLREPPPPQVENTNMSADVFSAPPSSSQSHPQSQQQQQTQQPLAQNQSFSPPPPPTRTGIPQQPSAPFAPSPLARTSNASLNLHYNAHAGPSSPNKLNNTNTLTNANINVARQSRSSSYSSAHPQSSLSSASLPYGLDNRYINGSATLSHSNPNLFGSVGGGGGVKTESSQPSRPPSPHSHTETSSFLTEESDVDFDDGFDDYEHYEHGEHGGFGFGGEHEADHELEHGDYDMDEGGAGGMSLSRRSSRSRGGGGEPDIDSSPSRRPSRPRPRVRGIVKPRSSAGTSFPTSGKAGASSVGATASAGGSTSGGSGGIGSAGGPTGYGIGPGLSSADMPNAANLVPPGLKADMNRVFDVYLQSVCSNLDATDSKGEPIHQTLMAKKMAKMAESNDFRPFKFRIQAFTNAFMDTLAQHGMGEDVVAQKKVKAYLWHQQPLISRFNDDGKKSKSKGNHVWHIMAKRQDITVKSEVSSTSGSSSTSSQSPGPGSTWIFRPFERRIAGSPPPLAYVGVTWSWQPRIWDPQMPSQGIPVSWNSPELPPWLSWKNGVLMGVPGSGDVSLGMDIIVEASFPSEQRDPIVTSFHVQVTPHTISQQHNNSFMSGNGERSSRRYSGSSPTPVRDVRGRGTDTVPLHASQQQQQAQAQSTTSRFAAGSVRVQAPILLDAAQVLRVVTESIRVVADAQSHEDNITPTDTTQQQQQQHRRVSLARQQRVLVTTAEALSSLAVEASGHLALPSVSLLAALTTEAVNDIAGFWVLSSQRASDNSTGTFIDDAAVVSSNAPALVGPTAITDVAIHDISASFRAYVAQAVTIPQQQLQQLQGETAPAPTPVPTPSNELEVLMAVKELVKARKQRAPSPQANSSGA